MFAYLDHFSAGQVIGQSGGFLLAILGGALGVSALFFKRILGFFRKFGKVGIMAAAILVPVIVLGAYRFLTHA